MIKKIIESIYVDRRGVMDTQGILIPGYKKVYLRAKGHNSTLSSELLDKPFASQSAVLGWFATRANMAQGYIIQELNSIEQKEFGDAFRIIGIKGTTIAKFNLKKGVVYFLDNEVYAETTKIKYQTPMAFHRLFIDDNKSKVALGV